MQATRRSSEACLSVAIAVVITLLAPSAAAELMGFYEGEDGEIVIEYRDDQHVRMERGSPEAGFMLVRPEGNFVVMHTDEGWRYMGPDPASQAGSGSGPDLDLENTGRRETVAGIEGVVYRFNAAAFGPEDYQEMVLTDHPQVVSLTRGFMAVIAGADGLQEWAEQIQDIPHKGVLRNDDFELLRIETDRDLPASRFEVPPDAKPVAGGG